MALWKQNRITIKKQIQNQNGEWIDVDLAPKDFSTIAELLHNIKVDMEEIANAIPEESVPLKSQQEIMMEMMQKMMQQMTQNPK